MNYQVNAPLTVEEIAESPLVKVLLRSEDNDHFATEWNEILLSFSSAMCELPDFEVRLEKLRDQFAFYEKSPLNEHTGFFGLFRLLSTLEDERMRLVEHQLTAARHLDGRNSDTEINTLKTALAAVLQESKSSDELRLSVLELFAELDSFRTLKMVGHHDLTFDLYRGQLAEFEFTSN
jgi:hypothetical protein